MSEKENVKWTARFFNTLKTLPVWKLILICVAISELLTFLISFAFCRILWGEMEHDVLIIGMIDSLLVSLVIVGILTSVIHIVRKFHNQLEIQNHELSVALSEIKTLQGILPICSYCKKVRNDKGYYEKIEEYLLEHSEMDFSHTVCPECMEKYCPEDALDQIPAKYRTQKEHCSCAE